uniref:Succinate dehydrogenase [ubiquinone] cytochrome b small subunit n=1 Tax=Globisporangium ultimum (strain ATCC 200006 / CBS 805.95 / DAOM BR144) TaxID=431595 RepID=K3WYC4_GLOUD
MMQRSLVRATASAAPRVSAARTTVRHFRKTAPAKYTENKQVSGLAGIIEADNATFTTKVFHYSSLTLLGLTPVAFILSPSPVAVPVDFALGVLIPIHTHIGMNVVISDYVPQQVRTLARVGWLGVTGVLLLGFLRVNIEGDGITETIKTVWRESPNKKHD